MDATTPDTLATADRQIEHALGFLANVFVPTDWIEVRLLPCGASRWFRLDDDDTTRKTLRWAMERNAAADSPQNVYVGANPRSDSGKKGDAAVPLARVVFADFDGGMTVDEALGRIRKAGLPEPSIIIQTGGGVHVYWILDEPISDMAAWTATVKGIIAAVGSDKTIFNPERIMRLPGSRNVKPEREGRPRCKTVLSNGTRHQFAAFPVKASFKKPAAGNTHSPVPSSKRRPLCDIGRQFIETAHVERPRSENLFVIWCDMKAKGWHVEEAIKATMERAHNVFEPAEQDRIDDLERQIRNAFKQDREPGYEASPAQRAAQAVLASAVAGDPHDGAADLRRPHTLTDVGTGRLLANQMRGRMTYVRERRKWFYWDGRRHAEPADHIAEQFAKRMHDKFYTDLAAISELERKSPGVLKFVQESGTRARLTAAIAMAQSEPGINTSQADYDTHPWLLNVRNGVIDLRSGELMPHDPTLMLTQLAAVEYVPDARSELWERFIDQVTSGEEEKAEFLQQAFGLALTGDVSDEVLVCHNGGGCNGKSTALEAVGRMLGDYAAVAPPGLFAARKFDSHPTEIAGLRGKRFVTAIEQEGNRALRESLIKQMTGGDTIRTRGMREDFWEMPPTWHIHIAYNTAPRLTGTDDGIRRRLRIVPWNASFKGAPDPTIKERLTGEDERSGILNWCLDGLRKRLASGRLYSPESVMIATDEYIDDEDLIGRFIAERTENDRDNVIELREMLRAFREWMQADGASRHVIDGYTANALGRELARRGCRKMRPDSGPHRKQTVVIGLRLVNTIDDAPEFQEEWCAFRS